MANKPLTVKLKRGQATLIYMSDAEAEEYEKLLINYDASKEHKESHDPNMYPSIGFHLNRETNRYELVTIYYNPLTREAKFDSLVDAGSLKSRATDNFKKAATKLRIV